MHPKLRRRLAALAFAAALAGCAGPAPRATREVARLAALAGEAELRRELRVLRLAEPAAREHLVSGWGESGRLGGARVAWSDGEASRLTFFLAHPRELRLSLRGAAPGARPLPVIVEVNGHEAGRLALGPALAGHALRVPSSMLVAGENRLRLVHGRGGAAAEGVPRRAAWESLALSGARDAGAPPPAEGDTLVVPAGSELGFYLELPPGGRLRADDGALRGETGALAVLLESERAAPRRLALLRPGGGAVDLPLDAGRPGLVRLALRAVPDAAGRVGTLRLAGARVLADAPAEARPRLGEPGAAAATEPASPAAAAGDGAVQTEAGGRPDVVVFLADTLRADRLAAYGGDGRLTPHADRFAAGATVYETAVAQAPWTRPAVASMFTGLGPQDHRTWHLQSVLPGSATTLAELLREAGYRTAAVSTNGHITPRDGFAQGFDEFRFLVHGNQQVDRVVDWTREWLDRNATDPAARPFFLYLHTIDPHWPYAAPRAWRERFAPESLDEDPAALLARAQAATGAERERLVARLRPLYDAEVAYNDSGFGALLALLERRGLLDAALVVFVADHGEEFLEHGELGHGWNLHAESLRVPLLVKYPRQRQGRREPAVAQHVDLLPTLAAAAGARTPGALPGRDLRLPLAEGEEPLALSHLDRHGRRGWSLLRGGWKLVLPETRALAPGPQLHLVERGRQVRETPGQELRHPLRVRQLTHLLRRELARERASLSPRSRELDAETRAELEALGYL